MDFFKPLQQALNVSPKAAAFIGNGYVLIVLAIALTAWLTDEINPLLLAVYLIGFSLVVLVLSKFPVLLGTLLAWFLAFLFSLWLLALFIQIVTQNRMTPPLAIVRCLVDPANTVCENLTASAAIPSQTQETVATENADSSPAITPQTDDGRIVDRSEADVFVQFAGFPRATIIDMSSRLVAAGWSVQGADRGGERLGVAAGLNEVRYFDDADEYAATLLARDVSASLAGNPSIQVKDFASTDLARSVSSGHLEIWVSE